ncbi:hypothetical protein V2J09_015956 [Rumex salicifolius]
MWTVSIQLAGHLPRATPKTETPSSVSGKPSTTPPHCPLGPRTPIVAASVG